MNKTLILVFLAIGVMALFGIGLFLFFSNKESIILEPLKPLPNYHLNQLLNEADEAYFKEFTNPLPLKEYEVFFKESSVIISAEVLYPKNLPQDYGLTEILTYKNSSEEALSALFSTKEGNTISFNIMNSFNLNPYEPEERFILNNGKEAILWEFEEIDGLSYTLLFAVKEVQDKTFSYFLISQDVSPQELVDIANSSL